MSKIKKVLALVLAMAMVMAMSISSFAKSGDTDGKIIVTGLAIESTEVTIYKIVSLDSTDNSWKVAAGVTGVDLSTNPVSITPNNIDISKLTSTDTKTTVTGTVEFDGLEEGAYLIIANSKVSENTTYNRMVGVTYKYNTTTGLIEGETARVTAKSSTIDVTKEASTNFVGIGTEVTFTITTVFPSFFTPEGNNIDGTYKIVDTPVGMTLDALVSVKVGSVDITANKDTDYTVSDDLTTVEFTSTYIGSVNAHAGEAVEITYKGTVTDGDTYTNNAQAFKDNTGIGNDDIPTHYTGTIEFTKYGDDVVTGDDGTVTSGTKLVGAEFTVKEVMGDVTEKTLYFVATGDGIYKQVVSGTEGAVNQVVVASTGDNKGTVSLTYMEAGTYKITEVVAPDGYKVDSTPKEVVIEGSETENVTVTGYMTDTKLASLPSTGGIGTTIFTVVGCLIMIAAAAMFFVSRRRTEK